MIPREVHAILGLLVFATGTVVGSFLNVCIYRIPWQKSVIWPDSRCPRCLSAIAARHNVPILGWLSLGGKCRSCRLPISARYPLVEALVGVLFVAIYLADVAAVPRGLTGPEAAMLGLRAAYHMTLVALLVAATFIDFDLFVIPDEVTVTGMVLGLAAGTLTPWVRPDTGSGATSWEGFVVGMTGLLVGGGLVWGVRIAAGLALRREAMGFGDVTLLAMIGAFLGWQAAVLTFFLAPFFGLLPALAKLIGVTWKAIRGRKSSGADHELPFGPYLSMAALTLTLGWPWIWSGWAKNLFAAFPVVFYYVLGLDTSA